MDKYVLYKFFDGTASLEEEMKVRKWMEESDDNRKAFFKERKLFEALSLNVNKKLIEKPRKIKFIPWNNVFIKVAAAVAIIISVGFYVKNNFIAKDTLLTAKNSVSVPLGQRVKLILPDGSVVWLNSQTNFQYPSVFANNQREVSLDGEAYFEVKGNKKCPFIVSTSKGKVRVTGTKFNVLAYSDNESFETSLMEGRVEVMPENISLNKVVLKPNQKSILKNNKLLIDTISDGSDYLWRDGLIAFKDKTLLDILGKLEKGFGVKIMVLGNKSALSKKTYTGKFLISDGVNYSLNVLQKDIGFKYHRDNESQIIYINK